MKGLLVDFWDSSAFISKDLFGDKTKKKKIYMKAVLLTHLDKQGVGASAEQRY